MGQDKCPYCGGTEIVENIKVTETMDVQYIGLSFKVAKVFNNSEPILADLCNGCGSITRFHVQNKDRKWRT